MRRGSSRTAVRPTGRSLRRETTTAGLNVGFLYKTASVSGGVARVSNTSGTQVGAAETWIDPATGALALLNDRPSLVLEATVNRTSTAGIPIVVIVSDLIGLEGIDSFVPAGSTTVGDRTRRKRLAQAESLANYVQGRLTANPGEHLLVTGSHNVLRGQRWPRRRDERDCRHAAA